MMLYFKPLPNRNILGCSKLKEFAEDNFIFNEKCRKFFKTVENTVEKGEIAHYYPQCFQNI